MNSCLTRFFQIFSTSLEQDKIWREREKKTESQEQEPICVSGIKHFELLIKNTNESPRWAEKDAIELGKH